MELVSYHGDPAIKEKYLTRVRAHIAADELIHGKYWENGKGCAVGCTIHSSDHVNYERELGIPKILAKLEDGIFESLPNGDSKLWPEQFLSAIPVGVDLSLVWPRFAVWMLTDEKWGVIQFAKNVRSRKAIQDVSDAYAGIISGDNKSPDWVKLRNAAYADYADYAYADYADYAAAYADYAGAYAAYAAYAAADYAAAAADYAAAYAAAAADYAAAYRVAQSAKLLKLLSSANGGI